MVSGHAGLLLRMDLVHLGLMLLIAVVLPSGHQTIFLTGPVFDLCCGIGSDLQALPLHAIGIDNNPLRCWMSTTNTGKETRMEDALQCDIPCNALIHIDPSRRNSEARLHSLDAMYPSIDEVAEIVQRCAGGCIKVSPAVNAEDLEAFPIPFELEYIEEHGRVVQCVIWFGPCAQHLGNVTATSMTHGVTVSDELINAPFCSTIKGWILEPNPRKGNPCL